MIFDFKIAIHETTLKHFIAFYSILAAGNHPVTSVEVFDIVGRKVKTVVFEHSDQAQILSIADLLPGNYILKIRSKEQFVSRKLSVY